MIPVLVSTLVLGLLAGPAEAGEPPNTKSHVQRNYHGWGEPADFPLATGESRNAGALWTMSYTPEIESGGQTYLHVIRRYLFPGATSSTAADKSNAGIMQRESFKQARSQSNDITSSLHALAAGDAIAHNRNLYGAAPSDATGDEGPFLDRATVTDVPERIVTLTWDADVTATDASAVGSVDTAGRQRYLFGEGGLIVYTHANHELAVTITDYTDPTWTTSTDVTSFMGSAGNLCFALDQATYSGSASGGPVLDVLPVTAKEGETGCGPARDQVCASGEFATEWIGQGTSFGAPPVQWIDTDRNGNGSIGTEDYDSGSPTGVLRKCETIAKGTRDDPGLTYPIDPTRGVPSGTGFTVQFEGTATNTITAATSAAYTTGGGPPHALLAHRMTYNRERGTRFANVSGPYSVLIDGTRRSRSFHAFSAPGTFSEGSALLGFNRFDWSQSPVFGASGFLELQNVGAGEWPGAIDVFDVDDIEFAAGADYCLVEFEGACKLGYDSADDTLEIGTDKLVKRSDPVTVWQLAFDYGAAIDATQEWVFPSWSAATTITRCDCETYAGTSFTIDVCLGEDVGDDTCTTTIVNDLVCDAAGASSTGLSQAVSGRQELTTVVSAVAGSPTKGHVTCSGTLQ